MLKSRFNKRKVLIIVAISIIICILTIMLIIFIPKTDTVRYEIIYDGIRGTGLIFRDETFYDLKDYEKVYYENVIDGQFVSKDSVIASAYKKGYIKATLEKLVETEKNIVTYQNQNIITGFDDKRVQKYDFEIEVAINKMSEQESGYIELYGTLCDLMSSRQEYIRNTYNTESNTYLQGLYADELSMTDSLKAWRDELSATEDGFIGFYCDGQEQIITTEKAQIISFDELDDLINSDINSELNGFKIVKDSKWYVLVEVEDRSMFETGNYYPVYISNETVNEAGYLEQIIENKKGCALVFSFTDNVEKYLDMRTANIFVGERIEGFCVDTGYIKNGTAIVKKDKSKNNIPVNVRYEDKDIVVFDVTDELIIGQKVYK